MGERRARASQVPDPEAKDGPTSGTARLVAKAPKMRASYDWQLSIDGIVWVYLARTMRADADVTGLVAGTRYFFRVRTLTHDGIGEWSQVVSLLVR